MTTHMSTVLKSSEHMTTPIRERELDMLLKTIEIYRALKTINIQKCHSSAGSCHVKQTAALLGIALTKMIQ